MPILSYIRLVYDVCPFGCKLREVRKTSRNVSELKNAYWVNVSAHLNRVSCAPPPPPMMINEAGGTVMLTVPHSPDVTTEHNYNYNYYRRILKGNALKPHRLCPTAYAPTPTPTPDAPALLGCADLSYDRKRPCTAIITHRPRRRHR